MISRWFYRSILIVPIIAVFPWTARTIVLNIAAIGFSNCQVSSWSLENFPWMESYAKDSYTHLLRIRLCPSAGDERTDAKFIMQYLDTRKNDPLLHYQLSGLYKIMNFKTLANRELFFAISGSSSVILSSYLSTLGLTEQVFAIYASVRHINISRVCEDIRSAAVNIPGWSVFQQFSLTCQLSVH